MSDVSDDVTGESETTEFSKKRKAQDSLSGKGNKSTKKARYDSTTYHRVNHSINGKVDVSAWKEVLVPLPVLQALSELGFSQPTEIQVL